jgi:hypothetical protein
MSKIKKRSVRKKVVNSYVDVKWAIERGAKTNYSTRFFPADAEATFVRGDQVFCIRWVGETLTVCVTGGITLQVREGAPSLGTALGLVNTHFKP